MKKKSLWKENIKGNKKPPLTKDIETNILIIGGGIAGISTAYHLRKEEVVLIDKDTIGMGVTAKTTGKLTFLQPETYINILKTHDKETAYLYLKSQQEAIQIITDIIEKHSISCHLEKSESYAFARDEKEIPKLKTLESFLKDFKIPFEKIDHLPMEIPCKYAIKTNDCYVFHPLEYINQIKEILTKEKVTIYEDTIATKIEKKKDFFLIQANEFTIKAKKVIVCTHYPFFIYPEWIPLKTYIAKSYVIASKEKENKKWNAINFQTPIHSIRYYNKEEPFLLYAGCSHPNATKIDIKKDYQTIEKEFHQYFNNQIDYIWSTHDIMTMDSIPYIGKMKNDPSFLIATGFNKWGMTNGTLAGKVLSDIVLHQTNIYEKLLNPNRHITWNSLINILYGNIITEGRYITEKIKNNHSFYLKNVFITRINGKKVGIYMDENGKEHIVSNICPHMKCNLIFNEFDKTWDCPCHGSRFDIDGNLLQGPSTSSIKYEKNS